MMKRVAEKRRNSVQIERGNWGGHVPDVLWKYDLEAGIQDKIKPQLKPD